MLVRRRTLDMEIALARMEVLIGQRSPDALVSGEAMEGIERQLRMALPPRAPERRYLGPRRLSASFDRMASIFMAAFGDRRGSSGFDGLRQAVVTAASNERDRLDVLVEVHQWLENGRDPDDVLSQLEDRFKGQGLVVVREPDSDLERDERFRYHGKGGEKKVLAPAYCVTKIEGSVVVVRQGDVELVDALIVGDCTPESAEAELAKSDGGRPGSNRDHLSEDETDSAANNKESPASGSEAREALGEPSSEGSETQVVSDELTSEDVSNGQELLGDPVDRVSEREETTEERGES